MSSNIVLPTLTNWTEQHITAVFQATNQTDFTSAVNAFFSDKVTMTVNGAHISRADFISKLFALKFDEQSATITFAGTVEVPADSNNPMAAGSVGVFFNASIVEGLSVLGAPITRRVTASVNLMIAQDPDIAQPQPSPIRGDFDGRRIMTFNQVTTNSLVPAQNV